MVKLVVSQRCSIYTLKHLLKIVFEKIDIHFNHKNTEQNADKLNEKEHQMMDIGFTQYTIEKAIEIIINNQGNVVQNY